MASCTLTQYSHWQSVIDPQEVNLHDSVGCATQRYASFASGCVVIIIHVITIIIMVFNYIITPRCVGASGVKHSVLSVSQSVC